MIYFKIVVPYCNILILRLKQGVFKNLIQLQTVLELVVSDNVIQFISVIFGFDCKLNDTIDKKYVHLDDFASDILDAGVFGKSSEDRLHSATVVLNAVHKGGKRSVVKSLFPPFSYMKGRFSLLGKLPFLLPLFWIVRIVLYIFSSTERSRSVSPANTIKIASERIELLKKMGII